MAAMCLHAVAIFVLFLHSWFSNVGVAISSAKRIIVGRVRRRRRRRVFVSVCMCVARNSVEVALNEIRISATNSRVYASGLATETIQIVGDSKSPRSSSSTW